MLISTKGRYALRVMLELADNDDGNYISLKKISEDQDISLKYLEIIVSILNKGKMLESYRGKNGGYRLNRLPENYTVGEILRLTEDGIKPVECSYTDSCNKACEREKNCRTKILWNGLDRMVNDYFDQVSLRDVQQGEISF